ncbi:hypothetical protein [Kitasatospora cinereorecta]|uniref:Uncharacterized protein n=1 Tax=Kitasatospora cinereorecta TaxID=285560 RepID=A0ABW0VEW4_9ACTN
MATTPRNSVHGPPRDDSRDGPNAGGGDGNSTPPAYAGDPYLQVIWGDAPVITGDLGPAKQGGGGGHRHHPAYSVDLGSVRDCENAMLGQARLAVTEYMRLKEIVRAAIDGNSVWGQQAMKRVRHPAVPGYHGVSYAPARPDTFEPDELVRKAGEAYAATMNPVMSQVLRQCADAIEATGQFMAMLNRAGQQYAHADRSSFFPDPPPPAVKS